MIEMLILVPLVGGLSAFKIRKDRSRRALLVVCALLHSALTAYAWSGTFPPALAGWLGLDKLGLLFLSLTSLLFLCAAVYAVGYLGREERGKIRDFQEGTLYVDEPEAIFTGCLLLFLATMTTVCVSQHFGILWVAIEATTLSSAPLIYFHRHHRSLEAAWKYLLICSVGIALALLGNLFLAMAGSGAPPVVPLVLGDLKVQAARLQIPWLKASFLFLLVGYGTKMGLAPLHTWLPDAHSESPSVVSALLSGALLNCAFLGILRAFQVCVAAGQGEFAQGLLVGLGLISVVVAAIFIIEQADFKRLLAYSSIEHMGILSLGVGLGGVGTFGAMLHAVNHSLTKAMLFFVAGNLLRVYKTKAVADIRGAVRLLPLSGVLWVAGFLAITGSPPFGLFVSEITILKAALDAGRPVVAGIYLFSLALVFIGMSRVVLQMAQGAKPAFAEGHHYREPVSATLPPLALGFLVLLLGLYIPPAIHRMLWETARFLGER
jgi:hydrogenase-4 component F